jgi:DNA adenine methylase
MRGSMLTKIKQPDFFQEPSELAFSGRQTTIPSLIKWTGSKRSQANKILSVLPPHTRYFEPFLGGGALLFALGASGSVASDIYRPLIKLWQAIQRSPTKVSDNYSEQWNQLNAELDGLDISNLSKTERLPKYFYEVRERFNRLHDPLDLNFIMRTCVNGIVRFNDRGEFNNSFHLSRRGMEPSRFERIVGAWQDSIRDVEFICQDYRSTLDETRAGDLVYFDPPYAGNKQRYAEDLNLEEFFGALDRLNSKGVKWALSFDGSRGEQLLVHDVPKSLFKHHILLSSGNSAVNKVLNGPVEVVYESLYLNYEPVA